MDGTAWLLTCAASLELNRPALIGTPVPGRGDWPMVGWPGLLKS